MMVAKWAREVLENRGQQDDPIKDKPVINTCAAFLAHLGRDYGTLLGIRL